jgi:serine/threonine-protein kinase
MAALSNTVAGVDGSPARRRPDREIPPELDALCIDALALAPDQRPSVREVADRVQRFLDGDRDVARRRARAAEQLAIARQALTSGDVSRRAAAMRAAGYALALDPESQDAVELVTHLMLEPPRELPIELDRELAAAELNRIARVLIRTC